MNPSGGLLELRGIKHYYGRKLVIDVPELVLREGELLAVLGPNGAGKSTLLRLMSLLEVPTTGVVQYRGSLGRRARSRLRKEAAVLFQRPHLWRGSVFENVSLGLRLRGMPVAEQRERSDRISQLLGIGHLIDQDVMTLSGGEVQRVALARALVLAPDVLFLDEPTANLDHQARLQFRTDLERVARQRAASLVLVTHDRHEAFYLADRIAVMDEGRVIQVGSPADLYENPGNEYVAQVTGAEFTMRGRIVHQSGQDLIAQVGEIRLHTIGDAPVGTRVKIAYRAEDVIVSRPEPTIGELSTRNLFFATVEEMRELGGLLRLRLGGPARLVAVVTHSAAEQLGLAPGVRVAVRLKATALHAFPAGAAPLADSGGQPAAPTDPVDDRAQAASHDQAPGPPAPIPRPESAP